MATTRTEYRCQFKLDDETLFVRSALGISEFKDGFWLNEYKQLSHALDCKYWIPPSAIVCVSKEVVLVTKD